MKKLLLLFLVLFTVGCSSTGTNTYKTISAEEAKNMIDELEDEIVLDVRSQEEFNEVHLENAINMTNEVIKVRFETKITDKKDATIIVYCKSGVRAKTAAQTLVDLGYTNVYTFGGIDSWKYEVIK